MGLRNKIDGLRKIWRFDNRWELLRQRLLFPNNPINVYRIGGLKIIADHSAGDANGAREVLTTDMYRRFLRLIDASQSLNVLDIGANNGGFPLLLKFEGLRIRRLVAVEFNPVTFKRLKANIETNFTEDFELINAALCGDNRQVMASVVSSGTSESIYEQTDEGVGVEGLSFDELYHRTFGEDIVDICKMDIEGSEFEVFESLNCRSVTMCRNLIIEIHHSAQSPRELVIDALEELGFEELNGDNKRAANLHYAHFFKNRHL